MQGFWKIWMLVWCWGVLLFGVVLALAVVPGANGAMGFILATMGSDPALASLMDQPAMQFAVGLQGALTIGWALTVLGVGPVRRGGQCAALAVRHNRGAGLERNRQRDFDHDRLCAQCGFQHVADCGLSGACSLLWRRAFTRTG